MLFEELFLVHLLPVLHWHNEQRSSILSSSLSSLQSSSDHDDDESNDDNSVCDDVSVVVPCAKLLSKMSGSQASELKELERNYEELLDENCRVFANYFKQVLENSSDSGLIIITPPSVVLMKIEKVGGADQLHQKQDENIKSEELQWENGRYNVML